MFDYSSKKPRLRDGEEKILNALSEKQNSLLPGDVDGLKFGEIIKETGLSHPTTSDYLKSLQNLKHVEKDVNTRRYCISENGQDELRKLKASEEIRGLGKSWKISNPIRTTGLWIVPELTPVSPLDSYPIPFTNEKVVIHGYLSLDEQHKDKAEHVIKKLKGELALIPEIFYRMGENLGKGKKHSRLRDFIQETKDRTDFDATFLFVFNGRQVASKIDWDNLMKSADAQEKQNEIVEKKLSMILDENKEYRKLSLRWFLRNSLRNSGFSRFSCFAASSPKELETSFLKSIETNKIFPKNATHAEIQDAMDELKKEGALKTVSVTKFVYELDKEKDDLEEAEFKQFERRVRAELNAVA